MARLSLLTLTVLLPLSIVVWPQSLSAQSSCLSPQDLDRIMLQIKTTKPTAINHELQDRLVSLRKARVKEFQLMVKEAREEDSREDLMEVFRKNDPDQLCSILKSFGWPTAALVGREGEAAAFFLLKNTSSTDLLRALLPLLVELNNRGEIERAEFAGYIDRLRLSLGLKQQFGTEVTIGGGFLKLYPIEAETRVDTRRKNYNLKPLNDYLGYLETSYQMPLVRLPVGPVLKSAVSVPTNEESDFLKTNIGEEDAVVRVETNLVSLDVSVYNEQLRTHITDLKREDFRVFEDDHEESISFFGQTQLPFDVVLLIDLSGSTRRKRDVIRRTTQRFIDSARPSDRLAIVTFTDQPIIRSLLTEDRTALSKSIKDIDVGGMTKAWDALNFTLHHVFGLKSVDRRRAVVFITDGVDNHLHGFGDAGSRTSFADLLEMVRESGALIVPIYVDTEAKTALVTVAAHSLPERTYAQSLPQATYAESTARATYAYARQTLEMLAEASGGYYYTARKIEDLNVVYDQVIDDLGKVYSLGYRPTNATRDGSWRTIRIEIINQPGLVPRLRPGYYAK